MIYMWFFFSQKLAESDVEPNFVSDTDADSDIPGMNTYNYVSQLNKELKSSQRNIEHKKPRQHSSPKKKKIEDTLKKAETTNEDHTKTGDSAKNVPQHRSGSPKKKNIFAELIIKALSDYHSNYF